MKINHHFIILITLLIVSCEKEPQPASLEINQQSFYLNDTLLEGYFIVSNAGDLQMQWSAETENSLINIDKYSGFLTTESDTVHFKVNDLITPGEHDFYIRISTKNDQHKSVRLYISIAERTGIKPSVGIHQINLYDTYGIINQKYGAPPSVYNLNNKELSLYGHEIYYDRYGLGFFLIGSETSNLTDEEICIDILIYEPYGEKTSENIGVESTYQEIINAYGEPEGMDTLRIYGYTYVFHIYAYYTKGIAFYFFHNDNDKLYYIDIFGAYAPYKLIEAKAKRFPKPRIENINTRFNSDLQFITQRDTVQPAAFFVQRQKLSMKYVK